MGRYPILRTAPIARERRRQQQGGQAIVMVTFALLAMCGLLGLAVDFGWAYFVKRSAQSAADAAAIAAAEEMRVIGGFVGPYPCLPTGGSCHTEASPYLCVPGVTSTSGENLDNACLYARDNGFQEAGRQHVAINEGTNSAPPTRPGVTLQYWVTVRISESVPQLFAAITGNPIATVSARATAGLYQGTNTGSIILLNRDNDVAAWGSGNSPAGVNLQTGGGPTITAGGGILMASGCSGGCTGNHYAGELQGSGTVTAPYTHIRSTGTATLGGSATWSQSPTNGYLEGSEFQDPTRKKAQIPVSSPPGDCGIPGGVIAPATQGGTVTLGPGNYYATATDNKGNVYATGDKIRISGNVKFAAGGSCMNGQNDASGFSTYVIYGGLVTQNGTGATNLSFDPGKIVMAGVVPSNVGKNNESAEPLFDMSVGGSAFSLTGPGPNSAGNVFIFTDRNYPGLTNPPLTLTKSANYANLMQGESGFKSGNNQQVSFTLDGLDKTQAGFPSDLAAYNSTVIWQDRRNSLVKYNADGTYNCSAPYTNCAKTNLAADGVVDGSPGMWIAAGATTVIRGTIYQPRGSWVTITASGSVNSALQLISGAIKVQGNGNLNLLPVTDGMPKSIVGLVE